MQEVQPSVNPPSEIIGPGHTYASITEKLSAIVLSRRSPMAWFVGLGIGFVLVMMLMYAVSYLFIKGVGIWGINIPVGWGFDIINFVWWIGIGHAGTLISAILLLLKQQWRTSINRFAEAMTLFAVACAGLYPMLHLGRPWFAYWLFPYPNTMGMWPQFRSPLVWDVFAVSTYAYECLCCSGTSGLIPDVATLRDGSNSRCRAHCLWHAGYGMARFRKALVSVRDRLPASGGLSTPLVISVHTIVSFDFATGIIPGWHTTIFPPYFVAGAIYSGFAMVLVLVIPIRALYKVKDSSPPGI